VKIDDDDVEIIRSFQRDHWGVRMGALILSRVLRVRFLSMAALLAVKMWH